MTPVQIHVFHKKCKFCNTLLNIVKKFSSGWWYECYNKDCKAFDRHYSSFARSEELKESIGGE